METLHIVYSSDDNYVPQLSASIASLLDSNKEFIKIQIHLLSSNISQENLINLQSFLKNTDSVLHIYPMNEILENLKKKFSIPPTISIASYSRLFIDKILPPAIEKVIYADSDSLFLGSLLELWTRDFQNNILMGVKDHIGNSAKEKIGLLPDKPYINAGFLFINLKKWREIDAEQQIVDFITKYNGNVYHHDQGVLNGCFSDLIIHLHPKYNVMTSFFEFKDADKIKNFYNSTNFYSTEEILQAINNPIFLHLTPSFSKRPWVVNSSHPLKEKYFSFLEKTPWKTIPLQKDSRHLKIRIVEKIFKIVGPDIWKKIFN